MVVKDVIQKVINQTDIVEVINEYIPLHPKGSSMIGLCPFHDDKNPSMSVSRNKKVFNCFSCNTKGNVIYFVSRYENITINQATIKLAKRLGINVQVNPEDLKKDRLYQVMKHASDFYQFYLRNSTEGQAALTYLYDRGITDDIINKFKIGLASNMPNYLNLALNEKRIDILDQKELGLVRERENGTIYDIFRSRIIFPLADNEGRVVGFSGRIYLPNDKNAKYINSQETILFRKSDILYNYHPASIHAKRMDKIYVFEGFMDVIAADIAGIYPVVATMGTAMTKEHVNSLLALTKNIILCFDGDEAGIMATTRAAEIFASSALIPKAIALPDGLDPDDYLKKYGASALETYLNQSVSIYEYLYDYAEKDLIVDDLSSIEKFKTNVFKMIRMSRSNVIKDFFIKKMASKLDVDAESLNQDFGSRLIIKKQPIKIPKKPSSSINDGVARSLRIILNLSMRSKNNYQLYVHNKINNFSPDYFNYFRLFDLLKDYYQKYDQFDKETFIKEHVFSDEEFVKIIDDSLKEIISEKDQITHIKDCLYKIECYQQKLEQDYYYPKAKYSNEDLYKYEKIVKRNVKLAKNDTDE